MPFTNPLYIYIYNINLTDSRNFDGVNLILNLKKIIVY